MHTCVRCSCHSDDFCTKPQFYTPIGKWNIPFFLVIPREHSDRGNLAGAYNRVWVSHHYVIARSNNGCDVAI